LSGNWTIIYRLSLSWCWTEQGSRAGGKNAMKCFPSEFKTGLFVCEKKREKTIRRIKSDEKPNLKP
jgi:hypothetical protein